MSRAAEELALRKQLLVTRASVQRLQVAQHLGALREELRLPRLARSVVNSRQGRSLLLAAALALAGRGRIGRALRIARWMLPLAGLAGTWWRKRRAAAGAGSESAAR